MAPINLCTTNIADGETVHQRCVLLTGTCSSSSDGEGSISIVSKGVNNIESFPEQVWPVAEGRFKALVLLSPGPNTLAVTHMINGNLESTYQLTITYIPLLQYPPLHLAIMVAKDSPLVIDCPPHRAGGVSSAHSDLDAAIAKFRMTAYMWQAFTAYDLNQKGLGRRSFRLDEEWAADTVSRDFLNAAHNESLDREGAMRATAKVHVIRSSRTTREIRDAQVAQQNPSAERDQDLFKYFQDALKETGGPFASSARPIVAGLILDSHYSVVDELILGHAALGCHDPNGISLGMFGSHLTYSWPRFVEEVVSCLTDTRPPGARVGNDNGECTTMWEACTIGQGAHLHEVGHALGSPHRPGIMERGYAQDWPKNFLTRTAYCGHTKKEGVLVTETTANNAHWNLSDALAFHVLPHFRLPSDTIMTRQVREGLPQACVEMDGDDDGAATLRISSAAGVVRVTFNGVAEKKPILSEPCTLIRYKEEELERRFDRGKPLRLDLLGLNGKEAIVGNVWKLLNNKSYIRIPGSNIRLIKRSVASRECESHSQTGKYWEWAQLLKERGSDGRTHRAKWIDLRVGCTWDGGVVKYTDGHVSHWGPMQLDGRKHEFGGHASEKIRIPPNVTISCIEVNRMQWGSLEGVRMHLSNGTRKGELNKNTTGEIVRLEPEEGQVIVGFFGKSEKEGFSAVCEFGIITVSKNVGLDGLPEAVYDLEELKNTCGLEDQDNSDVQSDRSDTMDEDSGSDNDD